MKKKVYCASPLGFSESGRLYLEREIKPLFIKAGLVMIDPWSLTDPVMIKNIFKIKDIVKRLQALKEMNSLIAENNINGINECDALFAVLDGSDVDSGTSAEIGYAFALGKKITAYRSDFRHTGDNEGATVNLQVEYSYNFV